MRCPETVALLVVLRGDVDCDWCSEVLHHDRFESVENVCECLGVHELGFLDVRRDAVAVSGTVGHGPCTVVRYGVSSVIAFQPAVRKL